jgi:hypothetical protein
MSPPGEQTVACQVDQIGGLALTTHDEPRNFHLPPNRQAYRQTVHTVNLQTPRKM